MWAHMWRKQWKTGKLTLGAFLDNEGVFDSTSFYIIIEDAKWHGLGDMIRSIGELALCWVAGKLKPHLQEKLWKGLWSGGCPQEGVLLPLLWNLVVYKLIRGLKENGCYTLGYADDIATIIHRKFLNTTSELLPDTLSMVQQWCERTHCL
jgi:hypothetical protein